MKMHFKQLLMFQDVGGAMEEGFSQDGHEDAMQTAGHDDDDDEEVVIIGKIVDMSRVMRKPMFWFPTRSDTNQAVQLQKMARGLKFRI